jgi:hypothetical protein
MVSHLAGLNSQCSGRRRESVNPPTSSWERAASARKRQKRSVPRGWKAGEARRPGGAQRKEGWGFVHWELGPGCEGGAEASCGPRHPTG